MFLITKSLSGDIAFVPVKNETQADSIKNDIDNRDIIWLNSPPLGRRKIISHDSGVIVKVWLVIGDQIELILDRENT